VNGLAGQNSRNRTIETTTITDGTARRWNPGNKEGGLEITTTMLLFFILPIANI
jgi:hypothetical protein